MDPKEAKDEQLLTLKEKNGGEHLYGIGNEENGREVDILKDELQEDDKEKGNYRKGLEKEGEGLTRIEKEENKMDVEDMQSKKEIKENKNNGILKGEEKGDEGEGEEDQEKEEEREEEGEEEEEDEKAEEEEKEEGDDKGEGRRGTDCSIVAIPEWLFERPNSHQDDATRGESGSSSEDKMESPRCRCCPSWHPWFFIGLGWLPILVGIFLSLSIVIPYCIAVGLKHVSPGFPYISDSGTVPPESCIFGQLLNMAAGLGLAGIYVRYKQVVLYSDDYDSRRNRMLQINKISLVLGIVACFGMSVVANFQIGNVMQVHFSGAFLLFAPGSVYGLLQAWLSYKMYPRHASILVCHIRLILSVIIAIFFILCTIFTLIAQELTHKKGSILHWAHKDGGYPEHIVATISEWVVAIAFLLYYFTFIREFQTITIRAELKHHLVYDALIEANNYPPVANYDNSFSGTL